MKEFTFNEMVAILAEGPTAYSKIDVTVDSFGRATPTIFADNPTDSGIPEGASVLSMPMNAGDDNPLADIYEEAHVHHVMWSDKAQAGTIWLWNWPDEFQISGPYGALLSTRTKVEAVAASFELARKIKGE